MDEVVSLVVERNFEDGKSTINNNSGGVCVSYDGKKFGMIWTEPLEAIVDVSLVAEINFD